MLEVMKFNPQLHYKTKTKIIFEYDDKRVSWIINCSPKFFEVHQSWT
jgi:hypothetical protein